MKSTKLRQVFFYLLLSSIVYLASCSGIDEKRTTISVTDPVRHYLPILSGQILDVVYTIENTGEEPLFIKDIHVSGGCELSDKVDIKVLPVGGKGFIYVTYDSRKNIGYVKNHVTIYGNFVSGDKEELVFDLNVVPDALYTKDYEEIYKEKRRIEEVSFEDLIDGTANKRRYQTD